MEQRPLNLADVNIYSYLICEIEPKQDNIKDFLSSSKINRVIKQYAFLEAEQIIDKLLAFSRRGFLTENIFVQLAIRLEEICVEEQTLVTVEQLLERALKENGKDSRVIMKLLFRWLLKGKSSAKEKETAIEFIFSKAYNNLQRILPTKDILKEKVINEHKTLDERKKSFYLEKALVKLGQDAQKLKQDAFLCGLLYLTNLAQEKIIMLLDELIKRKAKRNLKFFFQDFLVSCTIIKTISEENGKWRKNCKILENWQKKKYYEELLPTIHIFKNEQPEQVKILESLNLILNQTFKDILVDPTTQVELQQKIPIEINASSNETFICNIIEVSSSPPPQIEIQTENEVEEELTPPSTPSCLSPSDTSFFNEIILATESLRTEGISFKSLEKSSQNPLDEIYTNLYGKNITIQSSKPKWWNGIHDIVILLENGIVPFQIIPTNISSESQ